MTGRQMRQYEMFVRIHAFGQTYSDRFADGAEARKAFQAVGTVIEEIDAFNAGKLTARQSSRQRRDTAKRALKRQLRRIASTARVLAKTIPDADAGFPLPRDGSDIALLQAGMLFARAVVPMADPFRRCGLPATFVEDLRQAVTSFQQAIAEREAGKTGFTVSVTVIRAAVRQGMDAADSLDVLVRNALEDDVKAMAAWKQDRHVDRSPRQRPAGAPVEPGTAEPGRHEPLP